jgi:hypothetical protein
MPESEARIVQRHGGGHHSPDLMIARRPGGGENLTYVLMRCRLLSDLDVAFQRDEEYSARLAATLQENATGSGTTLIRRRDIRDVEFARLARSSALGTFRWSVPGVATGRCLFSLSRVDGRWQLTYLGIPRKSSADPTHGMAVFPRDGPPGRWLGIETPVVRNDGGILSVPPGSWRYINVDKDGGVWLNGEPHAPFRQATRDIVSQAGLRGTLVLRCSFHSRWRELCSLVRALREQGARELWFAVEVSNRTLPNEAFIRVDLSPEHRVDEEASDSPVPLRLAALEDRLLYFRVFGDSSATIDGLIAGSVKPPVNTAVGLRVVPNARARTGWIILVVHYLRRLGFQVSLGSE